MLPWTVYQDLKEPAGSSLLERRSRQHVQQAPSYGVVFVQQRTLTDTDCQSESTYNSG